MINYYEAEQFVLFAETGSLSAAAEKLHISSPTLSRSMADMEASFGVALFNRKKNRIELNDNGRLAAKLCKNLLDETAEAIRQVQEYDRSQRTISVMSCAPAPLWKLLPLLGSLYPSMTVRSTICDLDAVHESLTDDSCDILILPYRTDGFEDDRQFLYMKEHLSIYVRKEHALASLTSVSFADINGYNFLLQTELGFWDSMCRRAMPASRFLVQTDVDAFNELVISSSLPSFITDVVTLLGETLPDSRRISIPISDPEANVSFYCIVKEPQKYPELIRRLSGQPAGASTPVT